MALGLFLSGAISVLVLLGPCPKPSTAFQHDPCIDSSVCSCDGENVTCDCELGPLLDYNRGNGPPHALQALQALQALLDSKRGGGPLLSPNGTLVLNANSGDGPSLNSVLSIWPFTLQSTPRALVVRRCFSLRFHQVALAACPPRGLRVERVRHVLLHELSFHKMADCERMSFWGISAAQVPSYAFYHVTRVRLVEFRDAALDVVSTKALDSLLDVDTLTFVNCTIGRLEAGAVSNATDVGTLSFVGCAIGELSQGAIEARNVGHFMIQDCSIRIFGNNSVVLVNASRITVSNCSMGHIGERFLTAALTPVLDFRDNSVEVLDAGAFDGFRDVEALTVSGNVFGSADAADALDALFASGASLPVGWKMEVRSNWLPCDDRFCALLRDRDKALDIAAFYSLTLCDNGTRTLAEFLSMIDDDDVCQDGGLASGEGNAIATQASIAASSAADAPAARFRHGVAVVALPLLMRWLRGGYEVPE